MTGDENGDLQLKSLPDVQLYYQQFYAVVGGNFGEKIIKNDVQAITKQFMAAIVTMLPLKAFCVSTDPLSSQWTNEPLIITFIFKYV